VYLLEADGRRIVLRVHRGPAPTLAEPVARIRAGEGVLGKAVDLRRPVPVAIVAYPSPWLELLLLAGRIQYLASAPAMSPGVGRGSH